MKKVFKYISLVLIMLIGLAAFGLLLIFFVPNLTIFNVTAINYNEKIHLENKYTSSQVNTIVLNSNKFDVKIVSQKENEITCMAYANTFGYALKKNSEFKMTEDLDSGILTITVEEPNGLAFPNNSKVELGIPSGYAPSLVINNNASVASIEKGVKLTNLNYETKVGKLNIGECSILSNLNLKVNDGEVNIVKECSSDDSNLNLSITNGKFVSESKLKSVVINDLRYAKIELADCVNLKCSSELSGSISANTVSGLTEIKSNDLDVSIASANNIVVELTGKGSVGVGEVKGVNSFKTNLGSITIHKATNVLDVYSCDGNIVIENAEKEIVAKSLSGNVTINFAEDALDYSSEVAYRSVLTELDNGVLKVSGVERIRAVLKGNSSCNITMKGVLGGESLISIENGSSKVIVPFDSVYKLTTKSDGSVRVNLMQIPEYKGYTTNEEITTNINCSTAANPANSLIVKAKDGSVLVFDTKLAE